MKTVLVVDDEKNIRNSLEGVLNDEGFDVAFAESSEEALTKIKQSAPDIILLDIWLPGMDGIEVLRKVKERWKELPVILCTAFPHYKQEFGTWASDAYIVKSSDLRELKEKVKDILQKKQ